MAISEPLLNAINSLQQGDASGFDIIYNETFSYVHCRAKMIMKDEDSTNDLIQDTYIQAYQSIGSLLEPQSIFAWLGAITYRQGMKRFRNNHEVLLNEDSEELFEQIESEDIAWNPEQAAEQKAVATIVAEIIEELPAVQKAALTAFYYDNLKIVQIADMFQCSTNTIKSRLNYAKKYLREQIEMREKRDQVRLHSLGGGSILLLGLHELMSQAEAGIAVATVTGNLSAIHAALSLSETGTNLAGAAVTKASGAAGAKSSGSVAAKSAGTQAAGKTVFTAKTALITIGATAATVLVVATSIAAYNGAFSPKPASNIIPSETVSENSEDTQISESEKIMDTEKASESENSTESENASESESTSESQNAPETEKTSESEKTSEPKKDSEPEKSSEKKTKKKSKKKPKKESSDDDPFGDLDNPDIDVTTD